MSKIAGTQTISRACQLLRSFNSNNNELSLSDLAKDVGLHPATAYRLLQALVVEGFLTQDPESTKYSLGIGLAKIGELAKQSNSLTKIACPHVEKLAKQWGEATTIDILNRDMEADTILIIPSAYRLGEMPSYDFPAPAHCTATGKMLLAHLPPAQLEEFLQRDHIRLTPKTITDPGELKTELTRTRQDGYATNLEEQEVGLIAIAAPIWDMHNKVIAAISVGGPVSRLSDGNIPAIRTGVIDTARSISLDLGSEHESNLDNQK